MKKLLLVLIFSIFIPNLLHSQPTIEWQKSLGGRYVDYATSIQQTSDGGYIVAGAVKFSDGDIPGFHGIEDAWIIKLNSDGSIQWQKCLGGSGWDYLTSIRQTDDGSYIAAGLSTSNDGDVSGNHGGYDYWIVKLNSAGDLLWQKCLGGSESEIALSIQQTSDGGYIIGGETGSNDGDVSGNHDSTDYWVVKLSSDGNIQWQKCLGGSGEDLGFSVQQTSDGGYIFAGRSDSNDGDVSGNHGSYDYWIVKLNSDGSILWQKSLGGSGWEAAYTMIQQTSDDGYILAGLTNSNDGDVSGNHGMGDYWIVKLNSDGDIEWQKCLGGSKMEDANSIRQTSDGGYVVVGTATSNDGEISGHHEGLSDFWLVKLNSEGNIRWQKCLGGSGPDYGQSVSQTSEGGYIVAGLSGSNDGDVSGNHGQADYWIVKLSREPDDPEIKTGIPQYKYGKDIELTITPNPAKDLVNINNIQQFSSDNIQIFNLLGKVVKRIESQNTESQQIDISNLIKGVYFLKINNEMKMFVKE